MSRDARPAVCLPRPAPLPPSPATAPALPPPSGPGRPGGIGPEALASPLSDPPDEDKRAIVRAAGACLHGPDELAGASPEPGRHQPVRLAEQPVDPGVDIPAGRLD